MEETQVIYKFQRNAEEEIRISLREYKDRYYIDLRLWFEPRSGGEYLPTKKGLTVALDHASALKKGFEIAEKLAQEIALQSTSNPLK